MEIDSTFWLRFDRETSRLIRTLPKNSDVRAVPTLCMTRRLFKRRQDVSFNLPQKFRMAMKLRRHQKLWMELDGDYLIIVANPWVYRFRVRLCRARIISGERQAFAGAQAVKDADRDDFEQYKARIPS